MKYNSIYLTASWLNDTTDIKYNIDVGTNEFVSASVDIALNKTGLAIVFVYVANGAVSTGPENNVQFDDTTTSADTKIERTFLISGLLSISIYDGNKTIEEAQVELEISLIELNESLLHEENHHICGFYDTKSGKWSAHGCQVLNITRNAVRCYCSHLTSFAILMQTSSRPTKATKKPSSRITNVGVVLSIIFLIITLVIICGIKDLRDSERYLILRHLTIALLSANIFFALLDIDLRNSSVLCGVIAGCLHYSLLAAFSWMLIMSTDLYMKIRHPFMDHEKRFWYSRFAAWIGPVIVVGLTAAITRENYASRNKCWLDVSSGAVWTFNIPVCITLLIVSIQLIVIGYVAYQKSQLPNQTENEQQILKRMRTMLWRITLLTPSVGLIWIFGIVLIFHDSETMEYIFVVLNSFQGLLIWLSQCLFSKEVRTALKKTFGNSVEQDNAVNLGQIN